MIVSLKTEEEIAIMRQAGRMLAAIMKQLQQKVSVGISTLELDKLAEELVFASGASPAFKGYGAETGNPFPATICASLNDEVVHGIPSAHRFVADGDLLKIDIGIRYRGYYSDMARTVVVGNASEEARKLAEATRGCFWAGVGRLKDGAKLSDYAKAVDLFVMEQGFSVVRNLVGHGIGTELHEEPQVPNYFSREFKDFKLKKGMTLACEPMVNVGTHRTVVGDDGWVFKTADGKLSAHYENTILITQDGVEILTQ